MVREYSIGLAMAGGSTGGAYSAGVMDFFFEALRELEAARKAGNPEAPPWRVRLRTLSGTSAGGITAAIGMTAVNTKYEPVPNTPKPPLHDGLKNPFYRAWVTNMDFRDMFDTTDIADGSPDILQTDDGSTIVQSLLNANYISRRGHTRFSENVPTTNLVPDWAPEEIHLTTTNLRGVPYAIQFRSAQTGEISPFNMLNHMDVVAFSTSNTASSGHTCFQLDYSKNRSTDASWQELLSCANATSAFPGVFPAVSLQRPLAHLETIIPSARPCWPKSMPAVYSYHAVDGGALANEPFGICRKALERLVGKVTQNNGKNAWGSVILVDPFPNNAQLIDPSESLRPQSLAQTFGALLSAVLAQHSFLREELDRIVDTKDATQFSLAPSRFGKRPSETDLASAKMNGFGGLLDTKLRAHDFMLGRRNCQRFLQEHFVLKLEDAKSNPIFGKDAKSFANEAGYVPILPLMGSARDECVAPEWPSFSRHERETVVSDFTTLLGARIGTILTTYAKNLGLIRRLSILNPGRIVNGVVSVLISRITLRVVGHVTPAIQEAMEAFS